MHQFFSSVMDVDVLLPLTLIRLGFLRVVLPGGGSI